MNNTIAFDIDGVCVDIVSHIAKVMLRDEGVDISRPATEYNYFKAYPALSTGMVMRTFHTVLCNPQDTKIIPGTTEVLGRLYEASEDPVTFITARNPRYVEETYELVRSFCFVPFMISFSHKVGKLKFMNGFEAFVDDRRKICLELAMAGKTAYMPKRSYNKLVSKNSGIVELFSLTDLKDRINLFTTRS